MLPSIETNFENIDEEILRVITKTFEIQSCVNMLRFFQDTWQPKLREILNTSNKDEPSSLVRDRYATTCKNKNGKIVGNDPRYVSKQKHFLTK